MVAEMSDWNMTDRTAALEKRQESRLDGFSPGPVFF